MGLEKFFSLTNEGSAVVTYAKGPEREEEPYLPGFEPAEEQIPLPLED